MHLWQLRVCSFDSSAGAVEIPTPLHLASARRGVCAAFGSLWLFCCFSTTLEQLKPESCFYSDFERSNRGGSKAGLLTKGKQKAESLSPFLGLLLARPTSCSRPSGNAHPLIDSPPPAEELQRNQ